MKVAAVQLEAAVGDVARNLAECERWGDEAGRAGAEAIVFPEFFTTGVANRPELRDAAVSADGPATELLIRLADRWGALVGGSFLCRDRDRHVRNAFFLASPTGIVGRHDKDIPTMWENRLYVGGGDDGLLTTEGLTFGAAVCWEFLRSQTASRLRGKVDLVLGGSGWWSIPPWPPRWVTDRLEQRNADRALQAPARFARYVGAPVVHAAHAGWLDCPLPGTPAHYSGHFQGGALISDAQGGLLACRRREEGAGIVVAEVDADRTRPAAQVPKRFWLQQRGMLASLLWTYQNPLGRVQYWREYGRHAQQQTAGSDLVVASGNGRQSDRAELAFRSTSSQQHTAAQQG